MVMGVKVIGHEVYRGLLMGFMGFLSAEDACYPNHFPHCFYLSNKFHTSSAILFFFIPSFPPVFLFVFLLPSFKRNPFVSFRYAESADPRWYLEFTGPATFNGFWVGSKVTIRAASESERKLGGVLRRGALNLKEKWCSFHLDKLLVAPLLSESLHRVSSV